MIIGEAPGKEEDIQGLPSVGRLLDNMLKAAGFTDDELYICNIIKCRPPGDREPIQPEISTCLRYLEAQVEIVRPKVIMTLGSIATNTLLGPGSIESMRGKWSQWKGIPVLPTFHPKVLLEYPSTAPKTPRNLTWQDLKALRNSVVN